MGPDETVLEDECVDAVVDLGLGGIGSPFEKQNVIFIKLRFKVPFGLGYGVGSALAHNLTGSERLETGEGQTRITRCVSGSAHGPQFAPFGGYGRAAICAGQSNFAQSDPA